MVGDVAIPARKYTIIIYNDNTGDFFTPAGGRICGFKLREGRTDPLNLDLTKTILMLGHNTNDIYIYRDRLFASYDDYYNFTTEFDFRRDTTAGIPIIKVEKERTLIYAFDIPEGQIDKFNTPKHEIGANQNNEYTLILYDDEHGHLFDCDGSHICGVKKSSYGSYGSTEIKLNKTLSIYGGSTDKIYIKDGRLYVKSSHLSDDEFAYDGDSSKRKTTVRQTEEGDAVIYRFSKNEEPTEIIHNDRKHYSSSSSSSSSTTSSSKWQVSSISELERKLVGTVWTSRPTNGDLWYRVKFLNNHRVDYAYANASAGKWRHYDEQWYWDIKEAHAADTGEKYYNVSLREESNGHAMATFAIFKDGTASFMGPGRKQYRATEGDFNRD